MDTATETSATARFSVELGEIKDGIANVDELIRRFRHEHGLSVQNINHPVIAKLIESHRTFLLSRVKSLRAEVSFWLQHPNVTEKCDIDFGKLTLEIDTIGLHDLIDGYQKPLTVSPEDQDLLNRAVVDLRTRWATHRGELVASLDRIGISRARIEELVDLHRRGEPLSYAEFLKLARLPWWRTSLE